MIAILFLSLLQFSAAAIPRIMKQNPMAIAFDDVEGVFLEIPEFDDTSSVDYELSVMDASPLISLMQMAKKQSTDKNRSVSDKEKMSEIKLDLYDFLKKLDTIRRQEESEADGYDDIKKSIKGLKKLEHSFQSKVAPDLSSVRDELSLSKPSHTHETHTEVSTMTPVATTEAALHEEKLHVYGDPDYEMELGVPEQPGSESSVYEVKPLEAPDCPEVQDIEKDPEVSDSSDLEKESEDSIQLDEAPEVEAKLEATETPQDDAKFHASNKQLDKKKDDYPTKWIYKSSSLV